MAKKLIRKCNTREELELVIMLQELFQMSWEDAFHEMIERRNNPEIRLPLSDPITYNTLYDF